MDSCCSTCAADLTTNPSSSTDSKLPEDRIVDCCGRIICGKCIQNNKRFASYCPYCQVSSEPSPLPQGLRDPPAYTPVSASRSGPSAVHDAPPPYAPVKPVAADDEKAALQLEEQKYITEDTLHFLDHVHDSVSSLSLRYGVPAAALRQKNNITSDHLLLGRRTVLIPGEHYKGGVSLSPRPIEGEEEELRKSKIRRFMTACKVSEYSYALLYLEQSGYDLGVAMDAFFDDETWERNHSNGKWGDGGKNTKKLNNRGPFWRGL